MCFLVFFLRLVYLPVLDVSAQPCREEKLVNRKHRAALEAYIIKMEYLKLLSPDKGIVLLRRSTDSLFREKWYLTPTKYEVLEVNMKAAHLPQQYYRIKDRIVLVWNDDNPQLLDSLQKQPVLACLDSLLKDKVLPFEYEKWEWVTRERAFGIPGSDPRSQEKVSIRSVAFPPHAGSVLYVFNKDGTFKEYVTM